MRRGTPYWYFTQDGHPADDSKGPANATIPSDTEGFQGSVFSRDGMIQMIQVYSSSLESEASKTMPLMDAQAIIIAFKLLLNHLLLMAACRSGGNHGPSSYEFLARVRASMRHILLVVLTTSALATNPLICTRYVDADGPWLPWLFISAT